ARWLESQDAVFAIGSAPAGRQLVDLALEVGNNRAMRPCEHGRNNQADAFAAARRRITQNMLRSIVAKRVDLRAVRPFTDVNSFLVDKASLLDIRALRPARASVYVAVLLQGLPANNDMDCIRETQN